MPTGSTFLIIDPPDTPNTGRWKINYNFSLIAFSSFTGIAASTFTNPTPTTTAVGGVPAGSTFAGTYYLQDMMDLLLYPAVTPNFTSFLMAAQATSLEVGVATPTTANFTWAMASATDLEPNSISITDTTSSTLLAAGLANDGAESVFTGAISKTTPTTNVWTIAAEDTDGNSFSRTFSINWYYMVFYGSSASLTLNAAAIVALAGSELTTDIDGSYALGGSDYGYLCAPNALSTPNGFRDSSTNLPIDMAGPNEGYTSFDGAFYYSSVAVTRNGVGITYRVYRTRSTTTASSLSVAITGGTAATLQSVINAGNTATGNAAIIGNFSATTFFSGATELGTLLTGGQATRVQPGTNTTTGGTASAPTVNVVPSPSFTSVFATSISATTLFSGSVDLSQYFTGSVPTYVQPGTNTTTGGTPSRPTVDVVESPVFTSISASTLSATSANFDVILSAGTDLSVIIGSLSGSGSSTYVQPGVNAYTGGTASNPVVGVIGSPVFTAVTASSVSGTSVSATTFYIGSTDLSSLLTGSTALGVTTTTTSPKTPSISDAHSLMILSSSTVFLFYVPTNASVAFPIGTQIMLKQGGSGQLRVSGITGVVLNSYGNAFNHVGEHSTSFLTKEGQDTWVIDGSLTTLNL